MISAPIIPRTRESLWDLLESEPERIERGFALVQRELIVDEGIVVDAIARDTAGRLVLVFLVADDDDGGDRDVGLRVFGATQWIARNERLLLGALPEAEIRGGMAPRVVVLGFEFSETCVETLRTMQLEDLSIYRCEAFVLDGHLHAGMSPVLGGAADRRHDTLAVPPGVADAELKRVGAEIIDLVSRIDPNVEVQGDRYSRRFVSTHGLLAELFVSGDRLFISGIGPDDTPRPVNSTDSRQIADAIVRNYLEQISRPSAVQQRQEALEAALADAPSVEEEIESPEEAARTRDRLRIDHALHPLPRAPLMGDTEVSQEEFDAFSGLSSESKES